MPMDMRIGIHMGMGVDNAMGMGMYMDVAAEIAMDLEGP